ncbi:TIR domain-containing protein [Plantactinospora veratri]
MTDSVQIYDIAVSFAGAQRRLVEPIVRACQALGLQVFYDRDNTVPFWGRNFITGMRAIYGGARARYFVPFLSQEYLASAYPMDEFNAAMRRAIEISADSYILPIVVGSVQVPDDLLSPAIGFLRLEDYSADQLAQIMGERVGVAQQRHQEPREVMGVVDEAFGVRVPPAFSGTSTVSATGPALAAASPTPASPLREASSGRLRWQRLVSPIALSWRRDLDGTRLGQRGAETIEVHLAFPEDDARLQVSELGALTDQLADHGRRTGIFTRLEGLDCHADSTVVRITSSGRNNEKGLAVIRSGQRSTWAPLPRGPVGALLDVEHLVGQVTGMLGALTALDLPHGPVVVPAIGLDPATMISYGSVATPGNTASFGFRQPDYVHVAADEAVEYTAVVSRSAEVAAELVARLVADHRSAAGLR